VVTDSPTDKDRMTGGNGKDWTIGSTNDKALGGSTAGDFNQTF